MNANQPIPDYIIHDNSGDNPITDEGATLGRVLFYDVSLSIDDTITRLSGRPMHLVPGGTVPHQLI